MEDDEQLSMLPDNRKDRQILYDEAIVLTIPQDPKSPLLSPFKKCCAKCTCNMGILQFWTLVAFIFFKNCSTVFIFGSSFLTKTAKEFECFDSESD